MKDNLHEDQYTFSIISRLINHHSCLPTYNRKTKIISQTPPDQVGLRNTH
jgi:hypothetical protein